MFLFTFRKSSEIDLLKTEPATATAPVPENQPQLDEKMVKIKESNSDNECEILELDKNQVENESNAKKVKREADENRYRDANYDFDEIDQEVEDGMEICKTLNAYIFKLEQKFKHQIFNEKYLIEEASNTMKTKWDTCALELKRIIQKLEVHQNRNKSCRKLVKMFENARMTNEELIKSMLKRMKTLDRLEELGLH